MKRLVEIDYQDIEGEVKSKYEHVPEREVKEYVEAEIRKRPVFRIRTYKQEDCYISPLRDSGEEIDSKELRKEYP